MLKSKGDPDFTLNQNENLTVNPGCKLYEVDPDLKNKNHNVS